MQRDSRQWRPISTFVGLTSVTALLLSSGCGSGSGSGGADGPAPLAEGTYQRVLSQGVDPALVYTIGPPGFELAEQAAGVLGASDYGAVYVAEEPPYDVEVHLAVTAGSYDDVRCEQDPLGGPSDGPAAVVACEPEAEGWYRAGGGWHEFVVTLDGHHLVVRAPTAALDRDDLTGTALGARHQDGTAASPVAPATPVTRGDLPTTGDGAPVDPYGTRKPGG